ncbi:hypothetical protein EHQ64_02420 [Leptospira sarikeiensis]|uniref:Uncharacterized protein n=2 Tax=Leptospira sarikeiensis TaxID=2484943 RepID=A0A4R9KEM3_9LEPT|nr:hypothetical protein EHQ64_02420 [Leptospira sarikeiensis]
MKVWVRVIIMAVLLISMTSCSSKEESLKYYSIGLKAYSEKNLKIAIENFEKAIDQDKKNISARNMLGKSYYYSQRFEDSKKVFDDIVDDFPGNASAHVWSARILMYENPTPEKVKEAKEKLLYAIQLDDANPDAHYHLAKLYEYEGNVVNALLEYNSALKLGSQISRIHKDLATLYKKAGMEDRALEHMQALSSSDRIAASGETNNEEEVPKKKKKGLK